MPKFQLPPLKDGKLFEEFTCDLFNAIGDQAKQEPGNYQIFRVKDQKGQHFKQTLVNDTQKS
jgi:hypothetical protein